uniref:Uncharacterized protein n=1 Tax=Setaria italica TaxID=4555 RepID=K4AH06_SETIT
MPSSSSSLRKLPGAAPVLLFPTLSPPYLTYACCLLIYAHSSAFAQNLADHIHRNKGNNLPSAPELDPHFFPIFDHQTSLEIAIHILAANHLVSELVQQISCIPI